MSGQQVGSVAIVGAGFQGAQIAYRCAEHGLRVIMFNQSEAGRDRAWNSIRGWAKQHVAEGRLTDAAAEQLVARISSASTISECVTSADLVVESAPEILELKQDLWEQIDAVAPPGVLLGTNSSSLKSSDIGVRVGRKDLTFNVNFGMPVEDDLVEVMWNGWTSESTKAAVRGWLSLLGMVIIESKKEIKGYSFNRVWRTIKRECLFLADQGYCDPEDLDRAFILCLGTSIGPFQLMDKVGLDVVRDIEEGYYKDSGDERDRPPALLVGMVARGELGVKSGRGFYTYPHPVFEDEGWLHKRGVVPGAADEASNRSQV